MNPIGMIYFAMMLGAISSAARADDEVLVSAAASLKDVLAELAPLCLNATGVKLTPNLAASGILARQIEMGAPADIFISADEATMASLDKTGLLAPGTRAPLLGNALVVVTPAASTLKIGAVADLLPAAVKRIGIGAPATVPAGHYAQIFFQSQKVWDTLQPKFVPLENVRAVLAAVASENLDVGLVYRTDVTGNDKVRIAWTIPADLAPKIEYPIAILKNARSATAAAKVRQFLFSDQARAVFARYGFTTPTVTKPTAP